MAAKATMQSDLEGLGMQQVDFDQLIGEVKMALAKDHRSTFGIIGHTAVAYDIIAFFRAVRAEDRLLGVYSTEVDQHQDDCLLRPLRELPTDRPNVVIIASDSNK